MKKKFEQTVFNIMKENDKVVLITTDNDFLNYQAFLDEFPKRCYDFGIAECNALGAAAGLAKEGFSPIVYGVGAFIAYRAFEFLRCNTCIQNLGVVFVGFGAGFKINNFGATHHSTEDISVLRALPNLSLFAPASVNELPPVLKASLALKTPVYIRIGKCFETEIYDDEPEFIPQKSKIYLEGSDITLLTTGNIIAEAIKAANKLKKEGIDAEIINVSSLKPVDKKTIIESVQKTKRLLTIEEHQIQGGLASIASDCLAGKGCFLFEKMGLNNEFANEFGWYKDILDTYKLNEECIYNKVKQMILGDKNGKF